MTVVSVGMVEELKQTWLHQITCYFYSLNYDVSIVLPVYIELVLSRYSMVFTDWHFVLLIGERATAKNYCPVSLLSVVSKVFEKFVNNGIIDCIEKCDLFSDFQYGFRSSLSTADLVTVVSDGIARVFNRSRATRAIAFDISKDFDRDWHPGLLHKLKSYGVLGRIFGLTSSFLNNRWLCVILDGKSSEEY